MQAICVLFQISGTFSQWAAALLALALSTLNPAPRHTSQHHHQPVRLPELASAVTLGQIR
jgi:hypothetical protein